MTTRIDSSLDLSCIIPVYQAEIHIYHSLETLLQFLESTEFSYEIIAVDDGSTDNSWAEINRVKSDKLKLLCHKKNLGKFAAIKSGMVEARGNCCAFTEADLPYQLSALTYATQIINTRQFHCVIGDRTLAASENHVDTSGMRRLASKFFAFTVRLLVTGEIFDTQCGFKALRQDIAKAIFPLLQQGGFAGDVELLYIARKYNLELKRIPVLLQNHGISTVSFARHVLPMLFQILALRSNWDRGAYRSPLLEQIASDHYWEIRD